MIEYIYFVKCPNCDDEPFDFFDAAKEFAMGCLSEKPIITQVEVCRNDFGECTDSHDLGTIWSWEDMIKDVSTDESAVSIFTQGDFDKYNPDKDSEFDSLDNSVDDVPDNFCMPESLIEDTRVLTETDMLDANWAINNCSPLVKQMIADDMICGISAEKVIDRRIRFAQKTGRCPFCGGTLDDMICDMCKNSFRQNGCNGLNTKLIDALLIRSIEKADPKFKNLSINDKVEYIFNAYFGNPNESGKNTEKRVDRENNRNKILGGSGYDESANRVRAAKQKIKQEILLADKRETEINDALAKVKPEDYIKEDVYASAKSDIQAFGNIPVAVDESKASVSRKPIPEGMTIEQLVEEMEENEDTVECKWCHELFDKSEVRYEVDLGYLCDQCTAAIKSRGETLTFREGPLEEAVANDFTWNKSPVELEYDKLNVTLQGVEKQSNDPYESPYHDEWDEDVSYTYEVDPITVAEFLWDVMTEEDVASVPGGFETLEDDVAFDSFMEEHFNALVEKYMDVILKKFEDDAIRDYEDKYDPYEVEANAKAGYWDNHRDDYFDESCATEQKTASMLEELEDSETYRKRLSLCPECGADSFDHETGICISCGFNILTEELDATDVKTLTDTLTKSLDPVEKK